jgi:hypothetical protein
MSTPIASYWIVRVALEGGAHVDHAYGLESDARYYLADCQEQGYTAELIPHA